MASEHDTLVNLILEHANKNPFSIAINTKLERSKKTVGWWDVGRSDIHMCLFGRFIAIEVKIPPDDQRDSQKEYEKRLNKSYGKYWIVRSFEEYEEKYLSFVSAYAELNGN